MEVTKELLKTHKEISKMIHLCIVSGSGVLTTTVDRKFIDGGHKCKECGLIADTYKFNKKKKVYDDIESRTITFFNHKGIKFSLSNDGGICENCANKQATQQATEYQSLVKNYDLVDNLIESRDMFCGIGTRRTKLKLNKLVKQGELTAKVLRLLLELEDANITAKRYRGAYKEIAYEKKAKLLNELAVLFTSKKYVCGFQSCNNYSCKYILYFEYDGFQMSWHSNHKFGMKEYTGVWDGMINSTLGKLETIIKKYLVI